MPMRNDYYLSRKTISNRFTVSVRFKSGDYITADATRASLKNAMFLSG